MASPSVQCDHCHDSRRRASAPTNERQIGLRVLCVLCVRLTRASCVVCNYHAQVDACVWMRNGTSDAFATCTLSSNPNTRTQVTDGPPAQRSTVRIYLHSYVTTISAQPFILLPPCQVCCGCNQLGHSPHENRNSLVLQLCMEKPLFCLWCPQSEHRC
jgi:hypothetical protein